MSGLGNVLLALAFLAGAVSVAALFIGRRLGEKEGEGSTNAGYLATFGVAALMSLGVAILISAFFAENFTLRYVAENHSTDVSSLKWLYQLSGIWAGREGSLLFWAWLLALFAAWVAYRRMSVTDELSNMGLAVTNIVQLFFIATLFVPKNNPFKVTPPEWLGANGELLVSTAMNPLLQHWAMILHPPTLFIGYAGLAIPFAFAMAALITGDASKRWVELVDRITVFSWLFLGIGIGLGAIWAYVVLGWGGYWAWDPVENASLLPWLTGVGLLHSFTVYRRRDGFKGWAIVLAAVTFVLVILGTFITRSGIVQSVHSFGEDPLSTWLFGSMMALPLLAAGAGLFSRWERFRGRDEFESMVSKEASYYFNNVLMLVAASLVAYLTVSSALPAWLPGGGQSFGPATYDAVARPVGVLYVFIMAVCPILSWRRTDPSTFWSRVKWPLVGTAGLGALLAADWWINLWPNYLKTHPGADPLATPIHGWLALIGLFVAALAISVPVYLFVEGARKRSSAKGEGFGTALLNIITKARTQSGGYISHLGIGIILVGLIGSSMFVDDVTARVPQTVGSSFDAGGYTFTYTGFDQNQLANGDMVSEVFFDVVKDGRKVGVVSPGQRQFAVQNQTRLNVDVLVQPLRDVFVVFEGAEGEEFAMNVKINPLISYAWVGFLLLCVGTVLAVWPKRTASAAASGSRARSGAAA
ncbi:MAG: cytochrome c biogenesis protein CcsA [Coriobacteriia bacterium]|nr:cytochrome c biogenesis protein CcsA [Coriobacteriia bacterium]